VFEFCGPEAMAAGEELIERPPDHEFAIPGQLVADATITAAITVSARWNGSR